eukprot:CAMPEP_0198420694 /NCGR_PEP_ID=MMETSP1452-20131203/1085_1 /TAXON_ID=1181717 /ORGANISM="Synchroma pusillum, Strain CCMP3072" /LENGTH=207 /DNA_ID=CAMNT_0044140861 /DNA_START=55 /DNA_END=678 /DNA_ORIENTATION=-
MGVQQSAPSYEPDGAVARTIASKIPYYPFKGIDRFYDIQGMLNDPPTFRLATQVFVDRYRALNVDCIAGLDARGFVLGTPIALELDKPFVMLRKKGKLPNATTGEEYRKEYKGDDAHGADALCVSRTAIKPGDRVLVIDDLVATGGTLLAAANLLASLGAVVVECACLVELKALAGFERLRAAHPGVEIWSLISEDVLTVAGNTVTE